MAALERNQIKDNSIHMENLLANMIILDVQLIENRKLLPFTKMADHSELRFKLVASFGTRHFFR